MKNKLNSSQELKIKELITKYNDVLLISMRLAVAEDFVNLMVLNREDSDFILKDLFNNKEAFQKIIMKEFLKKNSSFVLEDLKLMENSACNFESKIGRRKQNKQLKADL